MNFIFKQTIIVNNEMILLRCIFTFKARKHLPSIVFEGLQFNYISVLHSTLDCFCYCLQDNISSAILS